MTGNATRFVGMHLRVQGLGSEDMAKAKFTALAQTEPHPAAKELVEGGSSRKSRAIRAAAKRARQQLPLVGKEGVEGASTRKSHAVHAAEKRARQQLLEEPYKLPGTARSLLGTRVAKVRSHPGTPTPKLTSPSASNVLLKARRPPEELPAGHVVYADLLLSLHASTRLSTAALQQLHRLRSAVGKGETHLDPYDDLVIVIEETPVDLVWSPTGASRGSAGSAGSAVVSDWYMVQVALQNALPEENVVTYGSGFSPTEAAAVELFRRAKLLVVSAGVVPSLLLAMFSSEGIPVIELVGGDATAAPAPKAEESGVHRGWEWTRLVAAGFGLERVTVHASESSRPRGDVFDPQDIAAAALRAMRPAPADDVTLDDKSEDGESEFQQDSSPFDALGLSDETDALLIEFVNDPEQFKVARGLEDRDRFGELLQRVTADSTERLHVEVPMRGAVVGVEFGDFSKQVLGSWEHCKQWLILDSFQESDGDARSGKVREVLRPWINNGVVRMHGDFVPEDSSLAFVYLDADLTFAAISKQLSSYWGKLAAGGIIAGHDFTRAHPGVAEAVVHFAETQGKKLFLTGVQKARKDVLGNDIPPCCPSWYIVKSGGSDTAIDFEAAIERVASAMNGETVVQGTVRIDHRF